MLSLYRYLNILLSNGSPPASRIVSRRTVLIIILLLLLPGILLDSQTGRCPEIIVLIYLQRKTTVPQQMVSQNLSNAHGSYHGDSPITCQKNVGENRGKMGRSLVTTGRMTTLQ